nr:unnamed protein product [Spirometra erinaceieuropaei]
MLVWTPVDVLVPHSALDSESNMNRLVKLLQQSSSSCNIVGVNRNSFNYQQGLENLRCFSHPHYWPSIYAFQENFFASNQILSNNGYSDLLEKLTSVLRQDVCISKGALQMRVQKCFAIKTGANVLLDLTRRAYAEQVEDISRLVNNLGKEYNLPLRVAYNKARGFFIQVTDLSVELSKKAHRTCTVKNYYGSEREDPNLDYSNYEMVSSTSGRGSQNSFDSSSVRSLRKNVLPDVFIKVQKSRGIISCTTSELIKLNERVKGSLNEVYLIADSLVSKLIRELHPEMSLFYRLSETVADLDLICSLAKVVVGARPGHVFVKPVFGDTLAIQSGRHPIMDALSDSMPVSNHTFASNSQNCTIILGPSMCGKSTYLCQVAQIQVMAQIGSFVPAKFAAVRLADKIFVRMGSRDDMFTNASTFMLEMREIGHIIRSATENSLVFIDDFGLCTTDEDCFALSCAVCDHLSQTKTFTFFATADEALSQMQFRRFNIEICYFSVEMESEKRPHKGLGSLVLPHRARATHHSITNLQASLADSSFDHSQFDMSTNSFSSLSTQSNPSCRAVPRVRYTYKLKKGVGPRRTCMLQLLCRFALDEQLLQSIQKYYDVLCQESNTYIQQEPMLNSKEDDGEVSSMNENDERKTAGHIAEVATNEVPRCESPTNDISMDVEPNPNISVTSTTLATGRPPTALASSVSEAAVKVIQSSPSSLTSDLGIFVQSTIPTFDTPTVNAHSAREPASSDTFRHPTTSTSSSTNTATVIPASNPTTTTPITVLDYRQRHFCPNTRIAYSDELHQHHPFSHSRH